MDRKALTVTEIAVKGEDGHVVLDRGEIKTLLKEGNVAGMFKFALDERSLPESVGEPERILNVGSQGGVLLDSRPKASSVISSSSPDRDEDVMWQNGMIITDNYAANPTVFGMHKHTIPVGFTEQLKQFKDMSWAQWQWTVESEHTEGKAYHEMWEGRILNCVSVGFMIDDWEPREKDNWWGGWNIKQWELLEHSPVGLPSNREAMRTDGLKSMFREYADKIFEGPSPVLRKLFEEFEHKGAPLSVPVNITLTNEKDLRTAIREGVTDALKEGGAAAVEMTCTTKADSPCDKAHELKTFEDVRLAAAAGVLPVDKAFEMTGELVDGYKAAIAEKDAALATAEGRIQGLQNELVKLSAGVVDKLG